MILSQVDAMASARMLTQLLRSDNIAHQIQGVANFMQIQQVFETSRTADIKTIIMLNCGAVSKHIPDPWNKSIAYDHVFSQGL